eukprot:3184635-Prorocentrum_lima.AAC.1
MHPSMWMMFKGPNPSNNAYMDKGGRYRGKTAILVDDLLQTGAKCSNLEFLTALERRWKWQHRSPAVLRIQIRSS